MTAPPLVLLAPGVDDPRTRSAFNELSDRISLRRPDLSSRLAFLHHGRPDPESVISELADAGVRELVLVPLLTVDDPPPEISNVLAAAKRRHPRLRVRVADPIGSHPLLLDALDARLRAALRRARVRELDGLVLALPRSRGPLSAEAAGRVARAWSARHRLPVIAACVGEGTPSVVEAVRAMWDAGRRHLALGSYCLAPGPRADHAAAAGRAAGLVVAEPLGTHEAVVQATIARYAVAGIELLAVPA